MKKSHKQDKDHLGIRAETALSAVLRGEVRESYSNRAMLTLGAHLSSLKQLENLGLVRPVFVKMTVEKMLKHNHIDLVHWELTWDGVQRVIRDESITTNSEPFEAFYLLRFPDANGYTTIKSENGGFLVDNSGHNSRSYRVSMPKSVWG